ncbi:hypothetical protein Dsin_014590 [Dipteronia sinensis]|uniref:Uncharacterized protein n=1 Tax=Dipteronia sinensis TaxID=43782 RepID=A0AAE0AN68_9ROSI|nr:hypothetical protein Dsin_014590 [Dipteronia sinensis]
MSDYGVNKEQDPWTANCGVQESFSSPAAIESQSHTLQDFSSFLGSSSPQQRVDFSSSQLYQSQAESEDLAFWEGQPNILSPTHPEQENRHEIPSPRSDITLNTGMENKIVWNAISDVNHSLQACSPPGADTLDTWRDG